MIKSTSKGELTRQRVLREAIRAIGERGFDAIRFQELADRCDLTQSAVMRYFPSRSALIAGVLDHVVAHNHQIVQKFSTEDREAKSESALLNHFIANLEWAEKYRYEARTILLLYYFSSFDPEFTRRYDRILSGARERIRVLLEKRSPHLDPSQWIERSRLLHDALLGGIVNYLSAKKQRIERAQLIRSWDALIETLGSA